MVIRGITGKHAHPICNMDKTNVVSTVVAQAQRWIGGEIDPLAGGQRHLIVNDLGDLMDRESKLPGLLDKLNYLGVRGYEEAGFKLQLAADT